MTADHARFMQAALALSNRNLGQVWPNPSVGAVLVRDGQIIADGFTARGGRPHAETQLIEKAGSLAQGATLYITLEPCSHHGKTPPCTDTLIKAGIARAVIACRDPNPLVNGKGVAQLQAAGIDVIENICGKEAAQVNRGFFSVVEKKRPYISLKIASSLDGKIAGPKGSPRWITSEPARAFGHLLRSRHDAILTGVGTVLADNPSLTCRLPGLEDRSPVRVVLDSRLRTPESAEIVKSAAKTPTWIFTTANKTLGKDVQLFPCEGGAQGIDLTKAMRLLAERGITRVMVEAGNKLTTSFLQSGMVDRLYWFRAPVVLGEGIDAASGDMLERVSRWNKIAKRALGPDTLEVFESCSAAS